MTPGMRTSEFYLTVLTLIGSIVASGQDYISSSTATHLSVYGAIAYILSRGLAKYEQGGAGGPPA
jgi:hypothetical protein